MKKMRVFLAGAALIGLTAGAALAQVDATVAASDKEAVLDMLEIRPPTPAVNTALVFTNTWGREVKVRLAAYDQNGDPAGSADFSIPPRGLKYFFVSRLLSSTDPRFVGWVTGRATLPVSASAVLLGIGTTDLPVERQGARPSTDAVRRFEILFPLVAAF